MVSINYLKGGARGFNTKSKNVQFGKKRRHVAAVRNEEPATKKQRKPAKNHIFFNKEVNIVCYNNIRLLMNGKMWFMECDTLGVVSHVGCFPREQTCSYTCMRRPYSEMSAPCSVCLGQKPVMA